MKLEDEIQKRGGRLDLESLHPQLKRDYSIDINRCNDAIQSAIHNYPTVGSIEFEIIDDYSFNAFACVENGKYFIGINRGVFSTFKLIFDRIMADSTCIPFIGNIEEENKKLPLIKNITSNYEYVASELDPFDPPVDRARHLYSKFMAEMAIDFILGHEIAHILNGHVDYKNTKLGIIHDELDLINHDSNTDKLISKALEMDADQGAVRALFSSELGKLKKGIPIPSYVTTFYKNESEVITRFSFVASLVSRIFGDQRLDSKSFVNANYPSPRLRALISLLEIPEFFEPNEENKNSTSSSDNYDIPKWAVNGYRMAEDVIEKISGIPSNKESLEDTWGKIGREQINTLYKYYNEELMDKIKSTSHVPLYPKKYLKI